MLRASNVECALDCDGIFTLCTGSRSQKREQDSGSQLELDGSLVGLEPDAIVESRFFAGGVGILISGTTGEISSIWLGGASRSLGFEVTIGSSGFVAGWI